MVFLPAKIIRLDLLSSRGKEALGMSGAGFSAARSSHVEKSLLSNYRQ